MAAVPAGYEAFHSFRRKLITLVCFLLASTMAIGITVYVDSYSVHEWKKNIDVGTVAGIATGTNIENYVDEIEDINGVTNAATLLSEGGSITIDMGETTYQDIWGTIIAPDADFFDAFPDYITLETGRLPESNDEVALVSTLRSLANLDLNDTVGVYVGDYDDNATIVGFYRNQEEHQSPYYWDISSIAIVTHDVLDGIDALTQVFIDINRARLSAFNPIGTLQFLNGIDLAIRRLDPSYNPTYGWGGFNVQNRLSSGVMAYMYWVQSTRILEMMRVASIYFLLILVTFLAIRHNVNERRYEENMLISRGAARGDLEKVTTREILMLAILSCLLGIPLGLLLSRVAISATGFFRFNWSLFISEPVLISLESVIMSVLVTIILPLITLGGYRYVYSTKKNIDEDRGKLAKLSKGLGLIRWDVLIVGISSLLLLAILTGGPTATQNSILGIILPFIPLPLFLGIASLSIKALRWGANSLSHVFRRIVGEIPSSIGIRRIGKGSSSAGAAAMILVLAICLSWNSAIIDASMPVTAQNQSRLSVGADLTFALSEYEYDNWDGFIANVTAHELVEAGTIVSERTLYLSAGYEGSTNFFAVDPREYKDIGYDYLGKQLNESDIAPLLDEMEDTPDGAIISRDVADTYEFVVGDVVRATTLEEGAVPISFRILGITEALPSVPERDYYYPYYIDIPFYIYSYYSPMVGTNRILVNRDYLGSFLTLQNTSYNYYCVSTTPSANASIIAEDVLSETSIPVVYQELWEAVSQNVQEYTGDTQYQMERALDTMLTVLTVGTIVGGFAIYALEGVQARRREIALLRSMGATKRIIIISLGTEMLVLMLFSMMLLLIYAPLFLSTSILMAGGSTTGMFDIYPVSVFPVIPWNTIFTVLGFFVVSVALFIFVIAALSSRISLSSTLNAAWAEAGPYGGDV
jgi:ABC-type antimicrobial peptide transport system permease subunit